MIIIKGTSKTSKIEVIKKKELEEGRQKKEVLINYCQKVENDVIQKLMKDDLFPFQI